MPPAATNTQISRDGLQTNHKAETNTLLKELARRKPHIPTTLAGQVTVHKLSANLTATSTDDVP